MANSMNLKWCKKNLELFSQPVYDLIVQEHPEIQCEVVDCVDKCGLCTDVPFVIRNNAVVAGRDPQGLYRKIVKGFSFVEKSVLPGTYEGDMLAAAESSSDEA